MTTGQTTKVFCRTELSYVPREGTAPGPIQIEVLDARAADLPGWQTCGFELVEHASAVTDWNDEDQIVKLHYAEISELAKRFTGCDHALVSGHIKRSPESAKQHSDLAPIKFVHSDFADSYGDLIRNLYRDGERAEAATQAGLSPDDVVNAKRIMIFQFWRNIGPAKMDMPLAFCDARCVPRSEVRAFPVKNYAGGGFDFDALAILAPAKPEDHRWYVFPEMQVDEVAAFRTYDSAMVGSDQAYWTPHSAIRDPEVEPGKPARSSIELRATCVFV